MYLEDTGYGCVDWIDLVRYRVQWQNVVNVIMNVGGAIVCCCAV
jgi:hypothetical protein